jgi:hypothetical protein
MPPLFVIGQDGKPELVNYRVYRNVLIADRLFAAAELTADLSDTHDGVGCALASDTIQTCDVCLRRAGVPPMACPPKNVCPSVGATGFGRRGLLTLIGSSY